jgi:hypothetical protein
MKTLGEVKQNLCGLIGPQLSLIQNYNWQLLSIILAKE